MLDLRALAPALLSILALTGCANAPLEVDLDAAPSGPPMRGWEASATMLDGPESLAAFPYYQDEVLDRAVSEVGLNRLRVHAQSGIESTDHAYDQYFAGRLTYAAYRPLRYQTQNDDDDPNHINWAGFDFRRLDEQIEHAVLPMKSRLEARGERLVWTVCYTAFTSQIPPGGRYDHGDPEEYAEFVLATYLHLKSAYGVTPDAWEVILEPDNKSVPWSTGEAVARAATASARRLRAAGFEPAFIAPSTMDLTAASRYVDEMDRVPGAFADLREISYHRYEGATPTALGQLRARARAKGAPISMLEYWFGRGDYKVLLEDLAAGDAVAWQGRTLKGHFEIDAKDPTHPAITLKPEVRATRHVFQTVRLGAQRVALRAKGGLGQVIAYRNQDGSTTLILDSPSARQMVVRDLTPGRYRLRWAASGVEAELEVGRVERFGAPLSLRTPGPGLVVLSNYSPSPSAPGARP